MRWGPRAAAVWLLVLAGSGLFGCSGRTNESARPSLAQSATSVGAGGAPSQAAPLPTAAQAAPPPAAATRQVISTATLRIEVRDIAAATARTGQLALEAGGFVAGSDESGAPVEPRGRVTLKVPADRFDRLVSDLAGLGVVRSKQLGTEDVTDQVVDLEARLGATRAAADRLQQLITRAATVTEVVGVEAELTKRTAEIESLEGRLRVLRDKVDLSTITVVLSPPQPSADDTLPGFLSGVSGGWRALRATLIVGSSVVGALLPWLLPVAFLILAARYGWRRWRRAHPPGPGPWLTSAGFPPALHPEVWRRRRRRPGHQRHRRRKGFGLRGRSPGRHPHRAARR